MTAPASHDYAGNPLPESEGLLWNIGSGEDRRFRRPILRAFPEPLALKVAARYLSTYQKTSSIRAASLELGEFAEKLGGRRRALASSDDDLVSYATRRAAECRRLGSLTRDTERAYEAMVQCARREGIAPPVPGEGGVTLRGAVARLCDEHYWRRAVRRAHGRDVEGVAIKLGMVHEFADIYASEPTVNRRREQKRRNLHALEAMLAVNELGQEYTLDELAALSVSNPKIRRGELMTRIAGFEQIADRLGHVGMFYTVTCPSRMHARLSETGKENPNYDGTTPRQAQHYLCELWARARAAILRRGHAVYGFRIAEPHHDGTPHWHLLLFMHDGATETVSGILRRYALAADAAERGADKYRFKAVEIDKARGTAAGYVAKYVSKNIDGFGVDADLFGKDPKKSAARVDAWAATWGIRQFQQLGGPSVTLWRELRRVPEAPQGILEDSRAATDKPASWARFTDLQGGPIARRRDRPIALVKRSKKGKYGEETQSVVGLVERASGEFVQTRIHIWTIKRGRKNEQCIGVSDDLHGGFHSALPGRTERVPRTERAEDSKAGRRRCVGSVSGGCRVDSADSRIGAVAVAREHRAPWSPVNNCTPPRGGRAGVQELYGGGESPPDPGGVEPT